MYKFQINVIQKNVLFECSNHICYIGTHQFLYCVKKELHITICILTFTSFCGFLASANTT